MKNDIIEVQNKQIVSRTVNKEKYLTFFINNQLYAIQSSYTVEIINIQPITFVPKLPEYIKGIINLRGKIIPLIDIKLKFKNINTEYNGDTIIIVVENKDMTAGLIVDGVKDVIDIGTDQITDADNFENNTEDSSITGIATVDNSVIMLLNVEKTLIDAN